MEKLNILKHQKLKEKDIIKNSNINSSDSKLSETEASTTAQTNLSIAFIKEISNILNTIISTNKKEKIKKNTNSPFNHDHVPKISIFDYLLRIKKYSGIENSTLIIALIYIDRICKKKIFLLTKYNIHRILFTSILISIKNNEDIIYNNSYFSKIGGVDMNELIILENHFLKIIDFELYVSDKLYNKYYNYINYNNIVESE